jgi:hypothetical protein
MYSQNNSLKTDGALEAGIISFKNLKGGLLKINFSSKAKSPNHCVTDEKLEEFMSEIKLLLQEIYNPKISFKEPKTLSYS